MACSEIEFPFKTCFSIDAHAHNDPNNRTRADTIAQTLSRELGWCGEMSIEVVSKPPLKPKLGVERSI